MLILVFDDRVKTEREKFEILERCEVVPSFSFEDRHTIKTKMNSKKYLMIFFREIDPLLHEINFHHQSL